MKIIELRAQNIKRLTAVGIKPTGELVEIAGHNGQGKTSVLDAIWWALGGQAAVQAEPIRHGQTEASVVLDLGELKVTREWKETTAGTKTSLRVENADGMTSSSPQALLDKLVGSLTFDPLGFARMKPREQRDLLMGIVGIGDELATLDANRKRVFEERTAVNRGIERLKGQLAGLEVPEGPVGVEVSIKELADELAAAQKEIATNADARRRAEVLAAQRKEMQDQIVVLEQKLAAAKDRCHQIHLHAALAEKLVATDVDPDMSAIRRRIAEAEIHNSEVADARTYAEKSEELSHEQSNASNLTLAIADIDTAKTMLLAKAEFPVPTLKFTVDGVAYGGVPFDQCSGAEQLRVSVAIGMSLNPKLRVLRITDGSLLDASNLALLEEMAREHDFQIWIERVEPGTKSAIVIEDGHVQEYTNGS